MQNCLNLYLLCKEKHTFLLGQPFITKDGENIINVPKMQNIYCAIKLFFFQYCDSNIELFSNDPYAVIAFDLILNISSLLRLFIALCRVIALP